jgi:hypothetical protein
MNMTPKSMKKECTIKFVIIRRKTSWRGILPQNLFQVFSSNLEHVRYSRKMTKEVCTVHSLDHRVGAPGSKDIKQRVLWLQLFVPQWQFVTRVEAPLNTVSIYLR